MLKIEKANYEGYIWYSDSKTPLVIKGEFDLELSDSHNPFIVEGLLYNADRGISIAI